LETIGFWGLYIFYTAAVGPAPGTE